MTTIDPRFSIAAPPVEETTARQPLRVLVVEDDPLNARIFQKFLQKLGGFEVLQTEEVSVMLELAATGGVDVVVMDVSLGNSAYEGEKLDGVQLTLMMKALAPALPVILVTAHAMKGDMERLLSASGADGYLSKPITDPLNFIAQVRTLGMTKSHG